MKIKRDKISLEYHSSYLLFEIVKGTSLRTNETTQNWNPILENELEENLMFRHFFEVNVRKATHLKQAKVSDSYAYAFFIFS